MRSFCPRGPGQHRRRTAAGLLSQRPLLGVLPRADPYLSLQGQESAAFLGHSTSHLPQGLCSGQRVRTCGPEPHSFPLGHLPSEQSPLPLPPRGHLPLHLRPVQSFPQSASVEGGWGKARSPTAAPSAALQGAPPLPLHFGLTLPRGIPRALQVSGMASSPAWGAQIPPLHAEGGTFA